MARTRAKPRPMRRTGYTPPPPPISEEHMQRFATLPMEIVRRIFEVATENWCKMDPQLVLVSHSVRNLVEPRLYQHLWFDSYGCLGLFCRTFKDRDNSTTKNLTFFTKHVKTLEADYNLDDTEELSALIKELVGLESLFLWDLPDCLKVLVDSCSEKDSGNTDTTLSSSPTNAKGGTLESPNWIFPYKNLRKLGFDYYSMHEHELSFTHPIFRDLTHLRIALNAWNQVWDSVSGIFPWTSFVHLPSLTHFSIEGLNFAALALESYVTTILEFAPRNLRVIILPCIDNRYVTYMKPPGNVINEPLDTWIKRNTMSPPYVLRTFPQLPFDPEVWRQQYSPGFPQDSKVSVEELHLMWRLALGLLDPRFVLVSSVILPADLVFRNEVLDLCENYYRYGSVLNEDRWSIANEIIEKRRRRLDGNS